MVKEPAGRNWHFNTQKKIRTCLAKQDQAGSYIWGLQLNYDTHFNQGGDFEIAKLYRKKIPNRNVK